VTRRSPLIAALSAATLLLVACGGDEDEPTATVELESSEQQQPADASSDDPITDDVDDPGDGRDDLAATDEALADDDLADLTVATPGRWPVGAAGIVDFDLEGDALVLVEVTTADGWSSSIDEQDDDEIEVTFRRGEETWTIEIELTDDRQLLEIEIDYDHDDAPEGGYDIGDAGSFAFAVEGDRLVLTRLDVAEGWAVTEREEDDDEFELELRDGDRRFEVKADLDDGRVELETDFEVRGPANR
jgi:hypothetical protein